MGYAFLQAPVVVRQTPLAAPSLPAPRPQPAWRSRCRRSTRWTPSTTAVRMMHERSASARLTRLSRHCSLVCSGAAVQGAARRVCGAVWRAAGPVRALAGCVAPLCRAPRARQPRITVAAHHPLSSQCSRPAPTRRSGPRAQGLQHTPICPRSPTSANRRPREPDRRAHRLRGLLRAAHGHRAGAPLPQRLLSPLGLTLLRT